MKKNIIIFITILVIVVVLFTLYIKTSEKKIIAENSNINWAWGFSYYGTVVCDDGSVYEFSMTDREEYEDSYENLNKLNTHILKNTTKYICKISKDEMNKIREYSKNITNQSYNESSSGGSDMGQDSISVWNYKLNEKITLQTYGDLNGKNSSNNTDELISLIKKHIK